MLKALGSKPITPSLARYLYFICFARVRNKIDAAKHRVADCMCESLLFWGIEMMKPNWIRKIGTGALVTAACLGASGAARADGYNHHRHGCAPHAQTYNYGYRPIVVQPYYGNGYYGGGYSSNYGSYSSNYGSYNNFGGGYGMGGFPRQGSYGGGAWPIGGSYGGGAYPRGGSYGGGGFSLYIGR
ncbi:MAG: hypothetical protein NTY15_08745 [Planctomycetota bacterium]|nr:hypothetical protein [Planctomycetota bacterium]